VGKEILLPFFCKTCLFPSFFLPSVRREIDTNVKREPGYTFVPSLSVKTGAGGAARLSLFKGEMNKMCSALSDALH